MALILWAFPAEDFLTHDRVSLSGLAVCLGNARLERLYGRERDLLSQRCKFLGLLGQCLELLA
jgi:hypothetical protein